jgi:hypothetical protein
MLRGRERRSAMFERERTLYAFTLNYVRKVMADIPDDRMRRRQAPGLNSPLWILGHLMTTHQAFHLGQLSACRRPLLGRPPLF